MAQMYYSENCWRSAYWQAGSWQSVSNLTRFGETADFVPASCSMYQSNSMPSCYFLGTVFYGLKIIAGSADEPQVIEWYRTDRFALMSAEGKHPRELAHIDVVSEVSCFLFELASGHIVLSEAR